VADEKHMSDDAARASQRTRQSERSIHEPHPDRDWLNDPIDASSSPVRDPSGRDDTDAMRRQSRR
jgi:hypothetical protein